MTGRRTITGLAVLVTMVVLSACGSGTGTGGDQTPLDAETSANSTAIAAKMLPSVAAELRQYLQTHPESSDLNQVSRWMQDQAAFLPSRDDWNPSSPPYWLVYDKTLTENHAVYGIASYFYGGDNGLLVSGNTWGHACANLAVDRPSDGSATTDVSITEVECPPRVPDKFNNFDPPDLTAG